MSSSTQRVLDLACDRALFGLAPEEEVELGSLLPPGADVDPRLEIAATAIALSELVIDEPLPAHLAEQIFAASARPATPQRTQGGTIPMASRPQDGGRSWQHIPTSDVVGSRPPPPRVSLMPKAAPQPPAGSPVGAASPPVAGPAGVIPIGQARRAGGNAAVWVGWLAAAACLALAIGSFVYRRGDRPEVVASVPAPTAAERRDALVAEARDLVRIPWSSTEDPAGKGETGEVVWSSARQEGYMTFRGLAENDPKKDQYQLWIFDQDRDERFPVDGGVFDVAAAARTASGDLVVPITARVAVGKPTLFAITVERPGGVVVSKRERIALAAPVKG